MPRGCSRSEFDSLLCPWRTLYFNHQEFPEVPHYFVLVNDALAVGVVVMPNSTTQIDGRVRFVKKASFHEDTLVYVSPQESGWILTQNSVFDCNSTSWHDTDELFNMICWIPLARLDKWLMPNVVISRLIAGIQLSKKIPKWVIDLL